MLLGRSPGWFPWLRVTIVVAAAGAVGLILAGPVLRTATARSRVLLAAVPVSLAAIAVLGGPLAYSIDTAASSYSGAGPSAGLALTAAGGGPAGAPGFGRGGFPGAGAAGPGAFGDFPGGLADGRAGRGEFGGFGGGGGARAGRGGFRGIGGSATVSAALARLLGTGASRYTWAAATQTSDTAAAMELASGGVPVMALGGFRGTDPALSLAGFEQLVSAHVIHYYVGGGGGVGGGGFGGRGFGDAPDGAAGGAADVPGGPEPRAGGFGGGGSSDAAQIAAWVAAHFTPQTVGGMTVYNLTAPSSGS